MAINVTTVENDARIRWVSAQTDTDARAPTAEGLDAAAELLLQNTIKSRQLVPSGITNRPNFLPTTGSKGIVVPGDLRFYSQKHPTLGALSGSHTIHLPALNDTAQAVSRYDRIYLLCFRAIVTAAIDPNLVITFRWRDGSSNIITETKENSQRIREYYALVWADSATDAASIWSALPATEGESVLTVDKSVTGVTVGDFVLYPLDANLVNSATYTLVEGSLELIDLLRVWRIQNTNQNGYHWGRLGEADFAQRFHLQPSYGYVGEGWQDWQSRLEESMYRLFKGDSLSDAPTDDRIVLNLVNGQVATTLDAPGIATASPNGSTALANGQRIVFTNREWKQQEYAVRLLSTDAGGGELQVTINFAGNSPSGAAFGVDADHKVFDSGGTDISALGTFSGSSGTGALTWTENGGNPTGLSVGDPLYLNPGIIYPAGSGFPVAAKSLEAVYLGSTALDSDNVKDGDITTYEDPANSESHIVIFDRARGESWIYKKFTVTSTGTGVAEAPSGATGHIAFISGPSAPSGKQDKPAISGLSNGASYDLLCYHAPPGSEQWQFQFIQARYTGLDNTAIPNGATIAARPIYFGNTQGGGNVSLGGDGLLSEEAIAFRLPMNSDASAQDAYVFSEKIQLSGEPTLPADVTFRPLPDQIASGGIALPRPGQLLAVTASGGAQSQGIAVGLEVSSVPLGVLKQKLSGDEQYQLIAGFVITKNSNFYFVVATLNAGAGSTSNAIAFDSDGPHYAAIDVFNFY